MAFIISSIHFNVSEKVIALALPVAVLPAPLFAKLNRLVADVGAVAKSVQTRQESWAGTHTAAIFHWR